MKAAFDIEIHIKRHENGGWYSVRLHFRSKLGLEFISLGEYLYKDQMFFEIRKYIKENFSEMKEFQIFITDYEK